MCTIQVNGVSNKHLQYVCASSHIICVEGNCNRKHQQAPASTSKHQQAPASTSKHQQQGPHGGLRWCSCLITVEGRQSSTPWSPVHCGVQYTVESSTLWSPVHCGVQYTVESGTPWSPARRGVRHAVESGTPNNGQKLLLRNFKTSQAMNFFPVKIAATLNQLPENIVSAGTVNTFKNRLDKFWITNPPSTTSY
ncbi:hypothetical protein FHG87_024092 [Trinorchestia longiramus]|nr:hypothetical protein FHG87_024092 [Trinorchestia longiramus]